MVSPYLFQSEMSDVTPKLNNIDKYVRAILVKDIATQLIESKIENDGRAPHGEVDEHPDDAKCVCSSISCNVINRAMQLHWSSFFSEKDKCHLVSNENENENENEYESESYDNSVQKGECPVGNSIVSKYEIEIRHVKVYSNISMKYD